MQSVEESVAENIPDVAIDVRCSGTEREMGRQQGEQVRERIERAEDVLTGLEAFRKQKPHWLPMFVFRRMAEIKSRRFLRAGLRGHAPSSLERLEGIAEAAGVSQNALFLINAMEAVLSDLSQTSSVPAHAACSAVAATGPATPDGRALLMHNFDYLPSVRPLYMLRECQPAEGLRSLEFTAAPLCGAVDGMNEAGLCLTYNYGYARNGRKPGPTLSMRISEVLARCRTVEQAITHLTRTSRWGGGLLMLADADGRIASLEISTTRSALAELAPERPVAFHTNRFQTPSLREVEVAADARYSDKAPSVLQGRPVHESANERHARLEHLLSQSEQLDLATLNHIMSDHGRDGVGSANTICMHGEYWHTTACLQLLPHERRVRVAYNARCEARFVDFPL